MNVHCVSFEVEGPHVSPGEFRDAVYEEARAQGVKVLKYEASSRGQRWAREARRLHVVRDER